MLTIVSGHRRVPTAAREEDAFPTAVHWSSIFVWVWLSSATEVRTAARFHLLTASEATAVTAVRWLA